MRGYEQEQNSNLLTPAGLEKQAQYDPAQGAALDCTPEGDSLRHQITAPVPMEIEQFDDKVVFRYEYWNAVRTVYLDGRTLPALTPRTPGSATRQAITRATRWWSRRAMLFRT